MIRKRMVLLSLLAASLAAAADDGYILRQNERTLEQIEAAYSQMSPVCYSPSADRWDRLDRTRERLAKGGVLRVVMLGDSIVNDTSRSAWDLVLMQRYPNCRIEKVTSVRGSTGCWWYQGPGRVQKFVLDHDPDLVVISGISQRDDLASIREVIGQIRAQASPDILLMTGAFGNVDPYDQWQWRRVIDPDCYSDYRKGLEGLAGELNAAFLDMEAHWAIYVRNSGKELDWFKRDPIHANERGEQILGRILANYLSLDPVIPGACDKETDPLVLAKLERFQDWKFGFMVHWGIYSQWGCIESWPLVEVDTWARPDDLKAWTERDKDFGRFSRDYVALNRTLDPQHFDPQAWMQAAKGAGMRYTVFTSKHHDGFCMFDTKQTPYRTTDPSCPFHTNPKADFVKEMTDAFREEGFGIGVYYSKSDWHHPGYWAPEWPHRDRNVNYDIKEHPDKWATFVDFTHGVVEELMSGYGPVDILWLDGGQVRPPSQDIDMPRLAAMARRHQPGLIVVDRTVGGRYENYLTPEQEVPNEPLPYVWETCMTMGDQWSYKADDRYKSTRQLIHLLVNIVAKGGNFLLNVGPDAEGRLPEPALVRMREIGEWMAVNGSALYGTRPTPPYKIGDACLTKKGDTVYAIVLAAEGRDAPPQEIALPGIRAVQSARVLGTDAPVTWTIGEAGLVLHVPAVVRVSPPCRHAWSFELVAAKIAAD